MSAEFGLYFLCLAFGILLLQTIFAFYNLYVQKTNSQIWLKSTTIAYTSCIILSFICLANAFLIDDFTVQYVAKHSNSQLPALYKIAAIWGAHEGSLLLWLILLAIWSTIFIISSQRWPHALFIRTLIILNIITIAFFLFTLFTSHPFIRNLGIVPDEGQDLNPLLQDPGLISHPPMLYMGYVGTAINYSIALAILWLGKYPTVFARLMRPWALACFCFLTLGIVLGSLWAYRELGWGGFWFWDPVENASFIPWLISTALIHSLIVTEKRGMFKNWSLLLCIILFSLSLLGTFLVRSGIITSVHAFAHDPARGIFLLLLLAVVLMSALTIYAIRAVKFLNIKQFNFWSKESMLLFNNIILVIGAATVLFGTIYPMILDSFNLEKLSVGASYFNTVFNPLVFLIMLFMGVGTLCHWQNTPVTQLKKIFYINFFSISVVVVLLVVFLKIKYSALVFSLALISSIWLISGTFHFIWIRCFSFPKAYKRQFKQIIGSSCAHCGLAITVIGIAGSSYFTQELEIKLVPGNNVTLAGYNFTLTNLNTIDGPNYSADTATFQIQTKENKEYSLIAEKRFYQAAGMVLTETAILSLIDTDLYIAMGEKIATNTWSFRIYVKPLVRFIWFGGFMMFFGGLWSLWQRKIK